MSTEDIFHVYVNRGRWDNDIWIQQKGNGLDTILVKQLFKIVVLPNKTKKYN